MPCSISFFRSRTAAHRQAPSISSHAAAAQLIPADARATRPLPFRFSSISLRAAASLLSTFFGGPGDDITMYPPTLEHFRSYKFKKFKKFTKKETKNFCQAVRQ
jgi:hypothetical protein